MSINCHFRTSDYIFATPDVTIQALQHELHGRLLLCVSIGYFVYDSVLSILQLGKYPGRMEIIVHHAITMVTLGSALLDSVPFRQLLPFCVFGLVIEINNIFIHIRSLMEISRYVNSRKSLFLYNMNSVCALCKCLTNCQMQSIAISPNSPFSIFLPNSFSIHIPLCATLLDYKGDRISIKILVPIGDSIVQLSHCCNSINFWCDILAYCA